MAARMGPLVLPRTPYAVSSARNNFKIDRYLNFSTGQISDRYSGGVGSDLNLVLESACTKLIGAAQCVRATCRYIYIQLY